MHPFKSWLSNVKFPIPYTVEKESIDWLNFITGDSFKEFLVDHKLQVTNIDRIQIMPHAPVGTLQIYAGQFYGKPLQRKAPHYDHHLLWAERKRYEVLTSCDDLLAINICHHDYLNQVQFWLLRKEASLNAILMNIASITIISSIAERLLQKTLNADDLKALNGGVAVQWMNHEEIAKIQNKVMNMLHQLVHYERIAFKDLTQDEIINPSLYLQKIGTLSDPLKEYLPTNKL